MAKNKLYPSNTKALPTMRADLADWASFQRNAAEAKEPSPTTTVSSIHRPRRDRLGSNAETVRMASAPPMRINSGAT